MTYTDIFGDTIELTDERWFHIVKEHPEVGQYKDRIQDVLGAPECVKMSNRDSVVLLYYKFYNDSKQNLLTHTRQGRYLIDDY